MACGERWEVNFQFAGDFKEINEGQVAEHQKRFVIYLAVPRLVQDPVAQVAEHLTFNQRVAGSSPAGITCVGVRYTGALRNGTLTRDDVPKALAQVAELVDAPS